MSSPSMVNTEEIRQQLMAYKNLLAPGFDIDVKLQILDDGSFELFFAAGDNIKYPTVGYWAQSLISTRSNCKELSKSLVNRCLDQFEIEG